MRRCIRFTGQPLSMEIAGRIIEQIGMRRRRAAHAEVAGRFHQTRSEVVMPDAIDHHPRGERILGIGDGVRRQEPAAVPAYPAGNFFPPKIYRKPRRTSGAFAFGSP